jgi:hypothetical protein
MGFLGLRYGPATRDQTDRRRISAVGASQMLRFEYVVRDGAFSARANFQPIPRCLTPRPCYDPSKMRARVVAPEKSQTPIKLGRTELSASL